MTISKMRRNEFCSKAMRGPCSTDNIPPAYDRRAIHLRKDDMRGASSIEVSNF